MEIVDFQLEHVAQALTIALENYNEERNHVNILPEMNSVWDITEFAKNGLGVAAIEDGHVIGYLGCFNPWDYAFDSTAKGTFSPIHAHGAISENRTKIYKRMYQEAAKKWVQRNIGYHAIGLYAHDESAISAFFTNGFGQRCGDAIRPMVPIDVVTPTKYTYKELEKGNESKVRSLRKQLSEHLGMSPCFMYSSNEDFNRWIERAEHRDSRLFVALDQEKIVAFLEVTEEGENFATCGSDMKNICGTFCLPEYRGQNLYQGLLNYTIDKLRCEGYVRLGVDYESFNPTAYGFWLKYFSEYTKSVTRRIDECAFHE